MCLMNRNRISETVAFSLQRGPEERGRAYKAIFSRPEKGSQSLWEARGQAFGFPNCVRESTATVLITQFTVFCFGTTSRLILKRALMIGNVDF